MMAYFISDAYGHKIVHNPSQPVRDNPDWVLVDCGCCNGIKWGGYSPCECERCGGSGWLYAHKKSRILTSYPGGPIVGRASSADLVVVDKEQAEAE